MTFDWTKTAECAANAGAVVRISVIDVDGSAPRDAGTSMLVWRGGTHDTIGGGRFEFEAIEKARGLLKTHCDSGPVWCRETCVYPLGPALGQCCGGVARLLFEILTTRELEALKVTGKPHDHLPGLLIRSTATSTPCILANDRKTDYGLPLNVARSVNDMLAGTRPRVTTYIKARSSGNGWYIEPVGRAKMPLYIYGAGHVGRAIVNVIAQLDFDIHWVDTARDRFPDLIPDYVTPAITANPHELVERSFSNAFHLVMTFSHTLDLAICHALLAGNDFAYLGLIGSQTKRARFLKRLRDGGISDSAVARLTCPIGISGIAGKDPATIAICVAAQLIEIREMLQRQTDTEQLKGTQHG